MFDAMLSIIVFFVVGALISWIRLKRHTRKPDYARTRSLFDMTRRRLEQKGLGDLMMTDYQIKTFVSSPKTADVETLQLELQNVLMEILSHLHMMPNVRLIVTKDPKELSGEGRAGEYDDQNKQIRVLINTKFTAEHEVAILCHESAHFFAHTYGIQDEDFDLNEGMADTLTILLGFSDAVLKADMNHKLPYLNQPEVLELRKLLNEYRKEQKNKQAAALELETASKQLRKNIDGARAMLIQVQAMISVKRAPTQRKRYSRKNMEIVQKTLLELESGAFDSTLARAETALSRDLRMIRTADAEVLDICAKLYRLMLALQ